MLELRCNKYWKYHGFSNQISDRTRFQNIFLNHDSLIKKIEVMICEENDHIASK